LIAVHGWPLHGFRNRLGIAGVVLVTFEKGLHVLCREQANIVSKRGKLASDVMRSGISMPIKQHGMLASWRSS
jgi:hypothetical protein